MLVIFSPSLSTVTLSPTTLIDLPFIVTPSSGPLIEPVKFSIALTWLFSSVMKSTDSSAVSTTLKLSAPKINVPFSAVVTFISGALLIVAPFITPLTSLVVPFVTTALNSEPIISRSVSLTIAELKP